MFYQTRFAAQRPVCGMQGLGLTDTLGSFVTGTVQMETCVCDHSTLAVLSKQSLTEEDCACNAIRNGKRYSEVRSTLLL